MGAALRERPRRGRSHVPSQRHAVRDHRRDAGRLPRARDRPRPISGCRSRNAQTFDRPVVREGAQRASAVSAIVGRLAPGVTAARRWRSSSRGTRSARPSARRGRERAAASLVLDAAGSARCRGRPRPLLVFMPLFFAFGLILHDRLRERREPVARALGRAPARDRHPALDRRVAARASCGSCSPRACCSR